MADGEVVGREGLTARPPRSYRNCPAVFTARTIVCAHATAEDPTDCPAPRGVLMADGSIPSHRLLIRGRLLCRSDDDLRRRVHQSLECRFASRETGTTWPRITVTKIFSRAWPPRVAVTKIFSRARPPCVAVLKTFSRARPPCAAVNKTFIQAPSSRALQPVARAEQDQD